MKRQALARSLVYQLAARLELERDLGAQQVPVVLPAPVDLSQSHDTPDPAAAAVREARPATTPAPAPDPAPRRTGTLDELGRAAGVDQSPLTDLPLVAEREAALGPIRDEALACTRCSLCERRRHVVFGEGNLHTDLVFVGEAPGADENRTGRPFVGRAGELLTAMIEKGLSRPRDSVYICNILKCQPPRNRDPDPEEIRNCVSYLHEQLRIIRPRLIIALGRVAAQILSGERLSMRRLRGRLLTYRGLPLLPVYHPAYLLRVRKRQGRGNQTDQETWQDLKKAIAFLKKQEP